MAKDKKGQLAVLEKLLCRKDLEYVVNACDAGREGKLIFRYVYDFSGSTFPVKRLWISSMEDSATREGFANLKDGTEYQNICEASVCRAKADWPVGMNATHVYTTKYFKIDDIISLLVDQQPVRSKMVFPITGIISNQVMILIFSGSGAGMRSVSIACCNNSILQPRLTQVLKSFLNLVE